MNVMVKPTHGTYSSLQEAYDWFNPKLFNDRLPQVLITSSAKTSATATSRATGSGSSARSW